MKNIKYVICILIILIFVSCEKRNTNIENISVEVRNDSHGKIDNFCLSDRDASNCIDEIKVNETKKIKISVVGETSLSLSYSIEGIKIYENYVVTGYIDTQQLGYYHFVIKDKKIFVTENISYTRNYHLDDMKKLDINNETKFVVDNHITIE